MDQNDVTQAEINRLFEVILGRRPVRSDDLLIENHGAESADILNAVTALEKKYQVEIPESCLPALQTPRDFFKMVAGADA